MTIVPITNYEHDDINKMLFTILFTIIWDLRRPRLLFWYFWFYDISKKW